MAGVVSFHVDLHIENAEALPELAARVRDASPFFRAFIDYWADHNEEKFDKAVGMEQVGAQVDDRVLWAPLAAATIKAKRRAGQPDAIMVATGELLRALTSPDLIFEKISPEDAVFGSPRAPEEEDKVRYNWEARQGIFLSAEDRHVIEKMVKDYLERGGDFEKALFTQGLAAARARAEAAQMDAEFESALTGKEGDW